MSPRAKDIKERKKQMGPDQNKKLLHGQKKSIKMKRETTIWENIFASDTSDKGLISKIYKTHMIPLEEDKKPN